ncbi:tetratricopeptide repeat protein [Streptomyces anulatus]|uniref:tetratricopeptide repeat protein n=1 Tax=Streptomyces anulatus TaxID=1892 RepID=UPI003663A4DC
MDVAMINLGILLGEAGGMDEAEVFFGRAADAGHTDAMRNLVILLEQTGRADEAEVFLRRANDGVAGAKCLCGLAACATSR